MFYHGKKRWRLYDKGRICSEVSFVPASITKRSACREVRYLFVVMHNYINKIKTAKLKEEILTHLGDVPIVADGCYRFSSHRTSTSNDGQLH